MTRQPAKPEKPTLRLGYMRLTDAAPLIMAKELGLFESYGLDVSLVREASWANMRDRLAVGELDAAQLLAPVPLTASLGIGGFPVPMVTGLGLGLNGNAICLSLPLFEALAPDLSDVWLDDPIGTAKAIRKRIAWRQERRLPPLTLATVHPFSMHTLLLRHWLSTAGIDPSKDIRLVVLPPEQMADQLQKGLIDGFCAGAPWPTLAVSQCQAVWVATGYHIWNNAPEKVLAVTREWHDRHPSTHLLLRLSLMRAGEWLDQDTNRPKAADVLARKEYLDLSPALLLPALTGQLSFCSWSAPYPLPDYHVFHRYACGYPWQDHASWCLTEISHFLRQPITEEESARAVNSVYLPDLYAEAAYQLNWCVPEGATRPGEGVSIESSTHWGISFGPLMRL